MFQLNEYSDEQLELTNKTIKYIQTKQSKKSFLISALKRGHRFW
jgi:hypothetical protein